MIWHANGFSCGERRNVKMRIREMLTDHSKRSCVLEDVLIKMSLHCSFLLISIRLGGTEIRSAYSSLRKTLRL